MLQRLPTLLILVIAPPALGAAGLRFEEAIGLAEGSREVQGARRAVEVKRAANAGISRLTANPQITVQPGYRVAQPHEQGIEIQATVSQGFSLAGLGGARRDGARAEADLLAAEARALSLQRRLDAAAAWIETWGAAQVLGEVRREEVVAGELQRLVDRSVALAASTRADGA